MKGPPCACGCGQPTSGKRNARTGKPVEYAPGHGGGTQPKYASDEERKAAAAARQRARTAAKRAERVKREAAKPGKASAPHPTAKCSACRKPVTWASFLGAEPEGPFCDRNCAGFPAKEGHVRGVREVEPTPADLEAEAVAA